jgi:type I restriction enzyme S subunit
MTESTLKNPKLRFPEFKENWKRMRISELTHRISIPVYVELNQLYTQIGIRSHGKGLFHKEPVTGKVLGNKRVFWVKEDLFVLNIVFAWEQAVAKTTKAELGTIASHRFPMFRPKADLLNLDFLLFSFLTKRGKSLLELASPGGAGRNKTLGQLEFDRTKINLPCVAEQKKITGFLSVIDEKIGQLARKRELLLKYKRGVMQQIFSQKIRFKDDRGNNFPDWKTLSLGELLSYEQPTRYLLKDTEYRNDYSTPVLTAGKSFILGHTNETQGIYEKNLPVIIFDDFTTASKFVDFPFKAKSSAMKILTGRSGTNLRFIFEAMQQIKFAVGGHERHWISKFSYLTIDVPELMEQRKIAQFVSFLDQKIALVDQQANRINDFKQGLLQQMFV